MVITGLTRNQFESNLTWVRIPLSPPNAVSNREKKPQDIDVLRLFFYNSMEKIGMVEKTMLLSILYKYYPKSVSAKFLAGFIPGGATKSEVNSVLYSNLSDFCVDTSYNWRLTAATYEVLKNQMRYKEMKINELCKRYNADRFVVSKLAEVDYQSFENAYAHAEYIAKCGNELPYLLPDDWLRLIIKSDTIFYQDILVLKAKQSSRMKDWHENFEKEIKIKRLCSTNGISEKSCKQLLLCSPYEVERRINEIKAFMRKMPSVSISISQAVLLDKQEFMNFKNTFRSNTSYKCTLECTRCTKTCILK